MEFCLTTNNKAIVFEGIKDPDLKQKVLDLTNSYLGELYATLQKVVYQDPMDVQVTGLFIFEPRVESCCICYENCARVSDNPVSSTCECIGKYYHEKCLRKWFTNKKICPTCRRNCYGKGHKAVKFPHPYETPKKNGNTRNTHSQFAYQCCGGTHAKKSSFKSLFSALKHARDKHNVRIDHRKTRGTRIWLCKVDQCDFTLLTDEDMLHHLRQDHHLDVIITK